jgi:uncharacterized nucleotidyltransferase DUF6036
VLQQDLREFIELLNSNKVEYLVVGAHALAFHGHPRYTGDIDILVNTSEKNARKIEGVILQFGFGEAALTAESFTGENQVVQLGIAPNRIDILTSLTGVRFQDAWNGRIAAEIDGLSLSMLSKEDLIRNKKALGRPKDVADLEYLERA